MSYGDYEKLREALRDEVALWKPAEQNYQTSLIKAKMNAGLSDIRLSPMQKDALFQIYSEAQSEEWCTKGGQHTVGAPGALRKAILAYVHYHPTATFANLTKEISGFKGELAMTHSEFTNVILWPEVSAEAIDAINSLLGAGEITMAGASPLSYAMDGLRPSLPVAAKVRQYVKPRWLPVCFSPGLGHSTKA